MDIRCRKTKCNFNDRYTCTAEGIAVSEKMLCKEYEGTDKKVPDTSKKLFEKTPDYAPYRDRKSLHIGCEAKCMFNDKKECKANGITVNAVKDKPFCMTYVKK